MKAQLEKRIQELEGQVEAVKKMMAALEDGCTEPKSRPFRSIRQAMSKPPAFALMVLAVFLVLGGSLQSQQQGDDALFIDPSGNVGIGTDQPRSQLDVRAGAGSDAAIRFGDAAGHAGLTANGDYFGLRDEAHNDRLSILQRNGHVGIGTTNPNRSFEIKRQDANTEFSLGERLFLDGSPGTVRMTNNAYLQNGQWAIKDADKKAVTLEMRDSGMLEIYGTRTAGKTDWQKLATFDASNDRVDFPGGEVAVKGNFSYKARYQRDDQPESSYDISPRYHLSLTGKNYGGKTRTIPQPVLEALCADPDGCQVRLAMTRWDADDKTESASVFFTFYYSAPDGRWRASQTDANSSNGFDGNGMTQHVRSIWGTCYFTDGTYDQYHNQGDKQKGMQLLVWHKYNNQNRTCECTLID